MSTRRERANRVPRCFLCGETRAAHYIPFRLSDGSSQYLCQPRAVRPEDDE